MCCTSSTPLIVRILATCLVAGILAACGGGRDGSGTDTAGFVGAQAPEAQANVVLHNDDRAVRLNGRFESVEGYLSQSAKVLRGHGDATAVFQLAVPRSGYYELHAWWPQAIADAGSADIRITHADGSTRREVNQQSLGGQWNSLGIYRLDRSQVGAIEFRARAGQVLLVDAVRFQFVGEDRPALAWRTDELPVGLQDHAYEAALEATGGTAPYRYEVRQGSLPVGITLDPDTGRLSGQPAKPGAARATVVVRDAAGGEAARELTIEVIETIDLEPSDAAPPARAPVPEASTGRAQALAVTTPDLSGLLGILAALPEGEWSRVNINLYSDVWTPAELRPLYGLSNPTPAKIIAAWSSFAWDSNRGNLILYGGGHANYRGNDVYFFRGTDRRWQRASLPSEMKQDPLGNWIAVDGADAAPASAHTFDNALFFPLLDRFVMVGGAADMNGGPYLRQHTATTSRKTGLYLFDPSRAHPDKVGGTTGSHVKRVAPHPEVVGGNMWSNRDMYLNTTLTPPPNEGFINGCSAYNEEAGKDVAYFRTGSAVYRYVLNDLADPSRDTWQRVGVQFIGPENKASCAYDPVSKVLLRTASQTVPFVYWNLNTAGPSNRDVLMTPTDPTGEFATLLSSNAISLRDCGMDFDPQRRRFALWCGDGRVWMLEGPQTVGPTGWIIRKQPTPKLQVPSGTLGTGILGKWKYIPNLDAFMGLEDAVRGNIWLYKPVGWRNPGSGNLPPQVSVVQPAEGATFASGTPITLSASASDSDGSVVRVEFFAGQTKVGETTAPPYAVVWQGAPAGSVAISAAATDNSGSRSVSAPVNITVQAVPGNQSPAVAISEPVSGATFAFGAPITISATASDPDGTIARVEFFRNGAKIGEATSAPYRFVWTNAPSGSSTLTARATDNAGAQTSSGNVTIGVAAPTGGAAVTLQRGIGGYAGAADTYLYGYHPSIAFGTATQMQDQGSSGFSVLMRFAIFQSQGGPVPDGVTITSATLSVYKYSGYDMVYALHRVLQPWSEGTATWLQRAPGVPWNTAGANGLGADIGSTPDASTSVAFNPGWVEFNVTGAVQQMSAGSANHGWRLRATSGYLTGLKRFYSAEFTADTSLRPKLVVTYQ